MADTITIRTDDETEHALEVLTHDGLSRSAAIRQAVLEAASRRERAARMRREVLRMDWISRSVRAGVPLWREPLFRCPVSQRAGAG